MNIVYLQCNMQMNQELLHPFDGTTVIGAVVRKFEQQRGEIVLVADLYDCAENKELVSYLRQLDVNVRISPISNITHRLVDFCETLETDSYIIRISGSQVLLNMDYFNTILAKMTAQECDYFHDKHNDGQVPEVVRASVILKNKDVVKKCHRYYEAFEQISGLRELKFAYPAMPIKIEAKNKSMVSILEQYNSDLIHLAEKVKDVVYRIGSDSYSYLTASGYLQTLITNELYDGEKKPIPWYTYPMIEFLKDRLQKNMNVFEYGCGFSTMFYSERVAHVISIEHDYGWYQKINEVRPENVKLQHITFEKNGSGGGYAKEYSEAVLKYHEAFDVICIDGRDRCRCAKNSIPALKKDGVIIFDDTDREAYHEAYQYLKTAGFKRLDFKGLIPSMLYKDGTTSIFYRTDNCFNL